MVETEALSTVNCSSFSQILTFFFRFDCSSRTYHYYFPRALASLASMQSAGQRMIGEHDFRLVLLLESIVFGLNQQLFLPFTPIRNFCKMDVNNGVVKFTRRVDSISVDCVLQEGEEEGPFDICRVKITAKAFLWHQVSCSSLFLVLVLIELS